MKNLLLLISALLLLLGLVPVLATTKAATISESTSSTAGSPQGLRIMFWNLENFFDYFDSGTGDSDKEFSAHGARHWGKKKFQAKCAAIAKTLMWAGDREGRMPDIFAVAEVENRWVLRQLNEGTMIRKYGYEIVHFDSPDPRGIDVGLLYRPQTLELLESRPVRVHGTGPSGSVLVTRDILLATFRIAPGDTVAVLVNHHPSKYGGNDTDWRRNLALARLQALKDSLVQAGVTKVIATGDFNDTPENTRFEGKIVLPFINLAAPLSARGEGTIRYEGKWELIDMFLVTPPLLGGQQSQSSQMSSAALAPSAEMQILHPPFLTVRDNVHSGDRPLRTYSGPRYLGGVSDHRPILLRLSLGDSNAF